MEKTRSSEGKIPKEISILSGKKGQRANGAPTASALSGIPLRQIKNARMPKKAPQLPGSLGTLLTTTVGDHDPNAFLAFEIVEETQEQEPPEGEQATVKTIEARLRDIERIQGSYGAFAHSVQYVVSLSALNFCPGNVLKFPLYVFLTGGGIFIPVYFLMAFICDIPLLFLESSLGQYAGVNSPALYGRLAPLFQGVGYTSLLVNTMYLVNHNLLLAIVLRYSGSVFVRQLPWSYCGAEFGTDVNCSSLHQRLKCREESLDNAAIFWNGSCIPVKEFCGRNRNKCRDPDAIPGLDCEVRNYNATLSNRTHCFNQTAKDFDEEENLYVWNHDAVDFTHPAEDYLEIHILGIRGHDHWSRWGGCNWYLLLCHTMIWSIHFVISLAGLGRIVYFARFLPPMFLIVFFFKIVQLSGSIDGLVYYLTPVFSNIMNPEIWIDALIHKFCTLGIGTGVVISISSTIKFNAYTARNASLVVVFDVLLSLLNGLIFSSIVGFMANRTHYQLKELVRPRHFDTHSLIFYTSAAIYVSPPSFYASAFFLGTLFCGPATTVYATRSVVDGLVDVWPSLGQWRSWVTFVYCLIGFLLGLPFVFKGGILLTVLLNDTMGIFIIVVALLETLIVSYCYGTRRFEKDYLLMMGSQESYLIWYFRITLRVLVPFCLVAMIIFRIVILLMKSVKFGTYTYPSSIVAASWLLASVFYLSPIVFFAIRNTHRIVFKKKLSWRSLISPTSEWRPRADASVSTGLTTVGLDHLERLARQDRERKENEARREYQKREQVTGLAAKVFKL